MDIQVSDAIRRYKPARAGLLDQLGPVGLQLVITAVLAAEPTESRDASRLLTHAATHVAWVQRQAGSLDPRCAFGPEMVERSIAEAARAGGSVSPFAANLRRVARAAAPKSGHVTPHVIEMPHVKAPYTTREQTALRGAAAGMPIEARVGFVAALSLGFGAGLVGPRASAVLTSQVVGSHDAVFVPTGDPRGGLVPLMEPWSSVLHPYDCEATSDRPLTEAYTSAGAQRFKRAVARASGVPHFDASRVRSTWICALLAGGVPVDVIAWAAGIKPWSVAQYLPHIDPATSEEMAAWLSTSGRARPPRRLTPCGGATHPPGLDDVGPDEMTVGQVLARFQPRNAHAAAAWALPIGDQLRDLVRASTIEAGRAQNSLAALSMLLAWAGRQPGMPLTIEVVLKSSTVERFCSQGADAASSASVRSLLRALTPQVEAHSSPVARDSVAGQSPYTEADLVAFSKQPGACTESDRRVLTTYLTLGLGVGATRPEVATVSEDDLVIDHGVMHVRLGDRLVPVSSGFGPAVYQLLAGSGSGPLAGLRSAHITAAIRRLSAAAGVEFSPTRLRATWLSRHLDRGVPLHVLVRGAGARISHIDALLETVDERDPYDVAGWLATGRTLPPVD